MHKREEKKAVILLSGGIDSTTVAFQAKSEGYALYAISFDYGQRHQIELECARQIAQKLNVSKHLIMKFNLAEIGGSALTDNINVPKISQKSKKTAGRKQKQQNDTASSFPGDHTIPVTYVPARNTIFLSFALAWAETLEASDIFLGANIVDYSGYPDCRPEFIRAFQQMANLATKAAVQGAMRFRIQTPLISLSKIEIIQKGIALGADYSLTWSCYDPQPVPASIKERYRKSFVPCQHCDSCRLRTEGFRKAGIGDPLLLSQAF